MDEVVREGGVPVNVYWEARETIWKGIPSSQVVPVFEIGVSDGGSAGTLIDAGYDIIGNTVHAEIVYQVSRAIYISEISGNTLTGLNVFVRILRFGDSQTPFLKTLIINNNPLIELINGTDTNFIVLNDLIIDNNTILNTHLSHLRVASQLGNITISNNFFGSKRDFLEDATPTRASLIQPSAPGDINIKGNTFNADHINQYIVALEQGKNVFLCDNLAVINTPNTSVGNKTFIENISATLLKKVEITNNSVTLIDAGTDPLYIFRSAGGYTGELLTISNNNADGPGDIILFDPPSNIIFDQFRMKNNSWVKSIQYRDNFPITPPIPDEIVTPGVYEIYIILNTNIPVTNSLTVTLPSSFLQDGQEVTISASDAGFNDITIDGGTIVGNPSSLSSGSSVKFKYRTNDDTWYLV